MGRKSLADQKVIVLWKSTKNCSFYLKEYSFHPFLLREYLNCWYVIGLLSGTNTISTFGLDRILRLNDSGKKFNKGERNKIAAIFRNVIGITAPEPDIPEEIELHRRNYQGNLLKTLPLPGRKKILHESPELIILGFKMVVNFELKQRLLRMATQAWVVKPERLRCEMQDMLSEAQNLYKNGFQ